MEFTDKSLVCIDCQRSFVWTAGEQLFYHDHDFRNEPKRCKECKARRQSRGSRAGERASHSVVCPECGRQATVPFKPTQGRPVYCRECFERRRAV